MRELHEHRAALATGRRLVRIGNWLLWMTFGLIVVAMAALIVSLRMGWEDPKDPTSAVIGAAVLVAIMAACFVVSHIGRKLISKSVQEVAAHPDPDAPETLRIGPKSRWYQTWSAAVMLGLAIAALAFIPAKLENWICATLLVAAFVTSFALTGPATAGVVAAHLDASGIMLPELGVHVPWTSISNITAKSTGVRIDIAGPVLVAGTLPAAWERRAATRLRKENGLDLRTDRQEDVLWVARRHHNGTP